jgi:hypothetical protein
VMAMGQGRHIEITGYGDVTRFVKRNLGAKACGALVCFTTTRTIE